MAVKAKIAEGQALWAKVFEPDTKFDSNGVYSVNLLIPELEAQELCEYLDKVVETKFEEEVKANPKKRNILSTRKGYDYHFDKDGNKTDLLEFKFKLKAKVQTRNGEMYEQKPVVVDAKRTPMNADTLIGNGSRIKVAFEPFPYVMASTKQVGVSLRLKGVQVIDLVEYQSGGSMFDEEDGFEVAANKKDTQSGNDSTQFEDDFADAEAVEGDF